MARDWFDAVPPVRADFASALYLGWRHPSDSLPEWASLTAGRPADLEPDALAEMVARDGAALQGCEAALLWPSTLHACMDVLEVVGRDHTLIASRNLYPIMGWALERQIGRGHAVHFAAPQEDLVQTVARCPPGQRPALLVPAHDSHGQPLDWRSVLQVLALRDGCLITDHTQLLGLFGTCQTARSSPGDWGSGGGGWLSHVLPHEPDLARRVLLVASWAKAFGAPLASVAGAGDWIAALQLHGATRVHCSPVSRVALLAAQCALLCNQWCGDRARAALRYNVRLLHDILSASGMGILNSDTGTACHPMLRISGVSAAQARYWQASLLRASVRCVAVPDHTASSGALVWLGRADHGQDDFVQLRRALHQLRIMRKAAS